MLKLGVLKFGVLKFWVLKCGLLILDLFGFVFLRLGL